MQSYSPSMVRSRVQNNPNAYPSPNNSYPSSPQTRFVSPNYHSSDIKSISSAYKREGDVQRGQMQMQQINPIQNVSFARNYKGRLYGVDPQEQQSKQRVQQQYRMELKQQIEDDRRRKDQRIAKERAEDEKLERRLYQNMQIEAQSKPGKKEEPSYFMIRSSKGKRAKLKKKADDNQEQGVLVNNFLENSRLFSKNEEATQMEKKATATVQKIAKRGGYHNKSFMDNKLVLPQGQQQAEKLRLSNYLPNRGVHSLPDEYMNEINYEEQRISRLMMSQQNMLRKLDIFKKEIMETNKSLQLDQELQKVRFKLRAKPLNMEKVYSLNPRDGLDDIILDNSEFYHLPMISKNHKIYEGDREHKKIKEKQAKVVQEPAQTHQEVEQQRELVQLRDKTSVNDKNIANPEQGQPQE